MNANRQNTTSLACRLDALDGEQRERHRAIWQQLQGAAVANRELQDGYAFGFSMDSALFVKAAEFITLERLCCPFLHFALELEPEEGSFWLKLTGGKGIKAFLTPML
jgi:hypothetical protein